MCLSINSRLLGVSNPAFLTVATKRRDQERWKVRRLNVIPRGPGVSRDACSSAAKSGGKISADNERTLMSIKGDERVPAHF
jgi:hypothetical protein